MTRREIVDTVVGFNWTMGQRTSVFDPEMLQLMMKESLSQLGQLEDRRDGGMVGPRVWRFEAVDGLGKSRERYWFGIWDIQ
jgi:hypothetical protein